jgi:hypothetical protein
MLLAGDCAWALFITPDVKSRIANLQNLRAFFIQCYVWAKNTEHCIGKNDFEILPVIAIK